MLAGIRAWRRIELEQLDLEVWVGSFEDERDVLRLHVRHAHVLRRDAAVDRQDVLLLESEQCEELDGSCRIRHGDRDVIRVAQHLRKS